MTRGPKVIAPAPRAHSRLGRLIFLPLSLLLATFFLTVGLAYRPAAATGAESNEVVLFLGQGFSGASKSWSLETDRPFLAIPYTGDAFRPLS